MRAVLLILLTACGAAKKAAPLPAPTTTTAFVFLTDYTAAAEVDAIDLQTNEAHKVLGAEVVSTDALVRTFGGKLYIVSRDFSGQDNSVTVLDPEQGYEPSCSGGGGCQFPLGVGFNAQDFWAVSATKAYLTSQPDSSNPSAPQYALRNSVTVMNPDTGQVLKTLDLEALAKDQGVDLLAEDPDGDYDLAAVYADGQHVFVALQMLGGVPLGPIPASGACGYVPGRVAVLDIDSDALVTMLQLSGANPSTRFHQEPGPDNLLIATAGSLGQASIEPCNGIERIDPRALTVAMPFATEPVLGATVIDFGLGADGSGIGFFFIDGDYLNPTYEVRLFNASGAQGTLLAPGPKGFSDPGFVVPHDGNAAYVGLPLTSGAQIQSLNMASGAMLDKVSVILNPVDVALFPGTAYLR